MIVGMFFITAMMLWLQGKPCGTTITLKLRTTIIIIVVVNATTNVVTIIIVVRISVGGGPRAGCIDDDDA